MSRSSNIGLNNCAIVSQFVIIPIPKHNTPVYYTEWVCYLLILNFPTPYLVYYLFLKKKKKKKRIYSTITFFFLFNSTIHHLQHKPIFHLIQHVISVIIWWSGVFHGVVEPPSNPKFLH
jgi:hypothetical protein